MIIKTTINEINRTSVIVSTCVMTMKTRKIPLNNHFRQHHHHQRQQQWRHNHHIPRRTNSVEGFRRRTVMTYPLRQRRLRTLPRHVASPCPWPLAREASARAWGHCPWSVGLTLSGQRSEEALLCVLLGWFVSELYYIFSFSYSLYWLSFSSSLSFLYEIMSVLFSVTITLH